MAAGVITRNYVTRNYVQNVIDSLGWDYERDSFERDDDDYNLFEGKEVAGIC